jgi:hypothetical protein
MKKKLLILSMLVDVYTFSNAQIKAAGSLATKQATIAATNSFDVARISKQVTDVLSP